MPIEPTNSSEPLGELTSLLYQMPDFNASGGSWEWDYNAPAATPQKKAAKRLALALDGLAMQGYRRQQAPDIHVEAPKVTVTTAMPAWLGWIIGLQGAGILGLLAYAILR